MSWDRAHQRWQVQFNHNYKNIFLGRFDDEEDAARAYDRMMVWFDLHGIVRKKPGSRMHDSISLKGSFNFAYEEYEGEFGALRCMTQADVVRSLRQQGGGVKRERETKRRPESATDMKLAVCGGGNGGRGGGGGGRVRRGWGSGRAGGVAGAGAGLAGPGWGGARSVVGAGCGGGGGGIGGLRGGNSVGHGGGGGGAGGDGGIAADRAAAEEAAAAHSASACVTCGADDDDGLLCDGCEAGAYTRPLFGNVSAFMYLSVLYLRSNDQNPTVNPPSRPPEGAHMKHPRSTFCGTGGASRDHFRGC